MTNSSQAKTGQQSGKRRRPFFEYVRRYRRLILFVVLAVLGIIFIAQNRQHVTTHFVFFTVTTRLWTGILVSIVLGIAIGYLAATGFRRRRAKAKARADGEASEVGVVGNGRPGTS
jgi:uncharacterized integral membrane protein